MFAAAILKVILPNHVVVNTGSINGFPVLSDIDKYWWNQLILEFFGTFFLMMMYYMCAVSTTAPEGLHGMAIGGVVGFMALAVPSKSASAFNPARV